MDINTMPIVLGLSGITALAATVLLYIFVLPENKKEKLPKVGKIIHDIFNFKQLFLEKILQAIYVLSSVACVVTGVLMLFGFEIYTYSSYWGGTNTSSFWYGGYGILLAILGPIVLRLVFESIMMFILLVKNVIEINKKLKKEEAPKAEEFASFND